MGLDARIERVTNRGVDLRFTGKEEAFRIRARSWLSENLEGAFAPLVGRGGPGDEDSTFDARLAWERRLGRDGWTGIGWPREHGGQGHPIPVHPSRPSRRS